MTSEPIEDRNNDRYDFAVWKMPQDVIDKLGDVTYFEEKDIVDDRSPFAGRFYLALGYPNSKNKKADNLNKRVQPVAWKYSSTVKPNDQLAKKLGIYGDNHLFLDFDSRHSKDAEGKIVNSTCPRGASGGRADTHGLSRKPRTLRTSQRLQR